MKNRIDIFEAIEKELELARLHHPNWYADPIHASAVIAEESGELTQAALQFTYEKGNSSDMLNEAIQVAAMAIRFIENFDGYRYIVSPPVADSVDSVDDLYKSDKLGQAAKLNNAINTVRRIAFNAGVSKDELLDIFDDLVPKDNQGKATFDEDLRKAMMKVTKLNQLPAESMTKLKDLKSKDHVKRDSDKSSDDSSDDLDKYSKKSLDPSVNPSVKSNDEIERFSDSRMLDGLGRSLDK